MRRVSVVIGLASVACLLLAGSGAAGLQVKEIGDGCTADESVSNLTAIPLGSGLRASRVESDGVITGWRAKVAPGAGSHPQQLIVLEASGTENVWEVRKIAESTAETVGEGSNEFATRIPVREHDYIGLHGTDGTFLCKEEKGSFSGLVEGDFPIGASHPYKTETETGAPVVAIVEPDRDGDSYGDESQDRCPQSVETHDECPTVTTEATTAVEPNAILVQVQTSSRCTVQVNGQVSWAEPKKGARSARAGRTIRTANLGAGGDQPVAHGTVATFTIPLHKAVRSRLSQLPPRQWLRARLTVETIDLVERVTDTALTVKLRGREHHKRAAQPSHTRHPKR